MMAAEMAKVSKVTVTPDPANANIGTDRGRALIRESLERCGAGRPIQLDKHSVVMAGNKTFAAAQELGLDVEVHQVAGDEILVVQRTDLDLTEDTGKARQLAYYDNRTQQVDLNWDGEQLNRDLLAGVDLQNVFLPHEVSALLPEPPSAEATVPAASLASDVVPPAGRLEPAPRETAPEQVRPDRPQVHAHATVYFLSMDQKLAWASLVRQLRRVYPGQALSGDLVVRFIQEGRS